MTPRTIITDNIKSLGLPHSNLCKAICTRLSTNIILELTGTSRNVVTDISDINLTVAIIDILGHEATTNIYKGGILEDDIILLISDSAPDWSPVVLEWVLVELREGD